MKNTHRVTVSETELVKMLSSELHTSRFWLGWRGRRWECYVWHTGWDHLSFGIHVCFGVPNLELHLPFCLIRMGRAPWLILADDDPRILQRRERAIVHYVQQLNGILGETGHHIEMVPNVDTERYLGIPSENPDARQAPPPQEN